MSSKLLHKSPKTGDKERGYLVYFESEKSIPFVIKRVYYVYNVPVGVVRGMHAHKSLQQALWCPYGEIEISIDDGFEKTTFILDSPEKVLIVNQGLWHELSWRIENSVLCAVASDYYNERDYIRDYQDFLQFIAKGYWDDTF
jgi:dTDP-4-dehydrorhamnose 3,5-epimerase-like enzyme